MANGPKIGIGSKIGIGCFLHVNSEKYLLTYWQIIQTSSSLIIQKLD